ncbi:MAG: hypothetical protein ACRDJM_08605, partial [Actinomycetota bacterium]
MRKTGERTTGRAIAGWSIDAAFGDGRWRALAAVVATAAILTPLLSGSGRLPAPSASAAQPPAAELAFSQPAPGAVLSAPAVEVRSERAAAVKRMVRRPAAPSRPGRLPDDGSRDGGETQTPQT